MLFVIVFERPASTVSSNQGSTFINTVTTVLTVGLENDATIPVISVSPVEGI